LIPVKTVQPLLLWFPRVKKRQVNDLVLDSDLVREASAG